MKFFKKLRRRRQLDRDLEEELAFHLEMNGRARFGNPTSIKETCRELWIFTRIESWWQDTRYAAKTLAKTAGVTITAVVALALGAAKTPSSVPSAIETVLRRKDDPAIVTSPGTGVYERILSRTDLGYKTEVGLPRAARSGSL